MEAALPRPKWRPRRFRSRRRAAPMGIRFLDRRLARLCLVAFRQQATATIRFHQARKRHSSIESAIGALQSGNGLKRCRDHSGLGFERYVALAILGRNLHTLGKLLIAQQNADCLAAHTERKAAA